MSIRELASRHGVHRRTVRQALASAEPPPRKVAQRTAPVLGPVKPLIDAMLREDLDAPRKQRHTARRIRERLIEDHQVVVAYPTVRDYVRDARPRIAVEAGRQLAEVFVPQTHAPGAEAEVDFADLWIVLAGVKTKVFLFTLRLSYSGRAVHRAYSTASQEAFLDGHRYAFEQLGGIPTRHIRYDNLKAAVSRVLMGRTRVESDRWVTFRSHYGFDVFYCRPGVEGAHEKGGVEGEGGRFRRTHTVPMPKVNSIAELNAYFARCDAKDDHRRVGQRVATVGDDFAAEATLLRGLPTEVFETGISLRPRVDRHARVTVRQCQYSVPARLVGRQLRVLLRATQVLIYDGPRLVAEHERSTVRGSVSLVLDHYLEVLAYKPGALPGATALVQARKSGVFTPTHDRYWTAAKNAYGDKAGTLKRPRFLPHRFRSGRMQVMPKKFTDEEKSRAVRMVHEQRSEYPTLRATCEAVGSRLGVGRETLRGWVGQAKVDAGEVDGQTTAEREEVRQLKAEVRRLREDNAILKAAATFFASGNSTPEGEADGVH